MTLSIREWRLLCAYGACCLRTLWSRAVLHLNGICMLSGDAIGLRISSVTSVREAAQPNQNTVWSREYYTPYKCYGCSVACATKDDLETHALCCKNLADRAARASRQAGHSPGQLNSAGIFSEFEELYSL